MKNRQDIKQFFLELEHKYPVSTWTIDKIHIWPIIRTQMFLYLVESIEPYSKAKNNTKPTIKLSSNPLLRRIQNSDKYKRIQAKKVIKKLKKGDFLFSSAYIYRSEFNNESFDKFADPILDQLNTSGVIVEHSPSHFFDKGKAHRKNRVFYLSDAFDYILKSKKRKQRILEPKDKQLLNWDNFIEELKSYDILTDYLPKLSNEGLDKLFNRFHDYQELYLEILNRVKPNLVFSICYYSFPVFALNHTAKRLGIKTVEIQHGPQTPEHLAYASWTNIPNEGFNTMPEVFWNWDKHSNQVIDNWTSKTTNHSNMIGGNPWIQFHKGHQSTKQNVILYSLQNQTLDHLFPDRVVKMIKEIKGYEWWLRLHPRQAEGKEELEEFLKNKGIYDLVNYKEATHLPLPAVLGITKLHITNFSGCALEAAEFGIPTILLEERGQKAFGQLIEEKKATYCPDGVDLKSNIDKLLSSNLDGRSAQNYDYQVIVDQLIK